jgi:endonuclease V-like protein UPF0215 family
MARPHILGIDDAPFEKRQAERVPIVSVMMEGADLIEGIAVDSFPVDGDAATDYIAAWVSGLRLSPTLQGVVLGGITIAGLGIVDSTKLAAQLGLPVLVVTRKQPLNAPLIQAFETAGLEDRIPIVERSVPACELEEGLYLACAGVDPDEGAQLVRATLQKSLLPEPLRVAHLIGRALVTGESRGRV